MQDQVLNPYKTTDESHLWVRTIGDAWWASCSGFL